MDVKNAVDQENVELPSGSIEGNTTELTIRTLGLMHTAEEFNNLILKEDGNRIVRFSDIGRAELGPADIKSYMKMNGVPMVGVVVIPQPGANHIEIANAVYDRMEKMKKDLARRCPLQLRFRQYQVYPRLHRRGEADGV